MIAAYVRCASRRDRARLIFAGLFVAVLAACAGGTGAPAELIGTWRLSGASAPVPEACATATLTFRRNGTFEGSSGTLKTSGRYSTTAEADSYRLKLDRLKYSGTENCQGVTKRDVSADMVTELYLAFAGDGRGLRLTPPVARESYIEYTRAN
jgi:hypothetical protein